MALAEQLGTFTTLVGGPEYVHCLLVSLGAGRPHTVSDFVPTRHEGERVGKAGDHVRTDGP